MKKLKELFEEELMKNPDRGKYRVLYDIYSRYIRNEIKLRDPDPPESFLQYLFNPAYSLWYITIIVIVILTMLFSYIDYMHPVTSSFRFIIGSIYLLLLPGYTTIQALFPQKRFSDLEELLISIGLSLAIITIMGLILNFSGLGIKLYVFTPILSSYILITGLISLYRQYIITSRTLMH